EARNAAMLSAAADMMCLLTKDGAFIDYHAADERQLLSTPASFMGRHMSEVLPASVVATYNDALARLAREPGPILIQVALSMPDGVHQYEARVVRCRANEVLVVVRDVTERKASERTL